MPGSLIHHGFEARARAAPEALAVVCGGRSLTYGELNRRANVLARRLVAQGTGPGQFVAVWAERTLDTIVHLLAVAKAGAAYVSLDPGYPSERLSFMLGETRATVLLANDSAALPDALPGMARLCASADDAEISAEIENLPPRCGPQDLAYLIYTSGSTGQPKGAMIHHAAVLNTLEDINERFVVGPGDRVLALSSFAFDLSVYDVFGVLGAGGAIVLPDAGSHREPAAWAELVLRHRVTIWNAVPALMEMLVAHAEATGSAALRSLRLAMLSGDWIPVSLPDRILRLSPTTSVVSLGGPTEVSIWSAVYPIEKVDPAWPSIPYGRPLRNQTLHVLDDDLNPCPVGTPGEQYCGGIGVGRGYLNRADLTSERFIADPFSSEPGARLYRTGDLGRWMPDGNIEFLGRIDNQVKINGNRVELGEIESTIARHPGVRDVAVVAPRDSHGRRRVVAFVVPNERFELTDDPTTTSSSQKSFPEVERSLREYLAIKLPAYMLPSRILARDKLPLSHNGKVDRKSLDAEALALTPPERPVMAARNDIERRLLDIWRHILDLPDIDVDDDFFMLGGDSLLAVVLLTHVDKEFDTSLQLVDLVQHPTISTLARLLRSDTAPLRRQTAIAIQLGDDRPILFFAPCIHGDLMTVRALASRLDMGQPVYALTPAGVDGQDPPHDTIAEIADYYIAQVREAQPRGPYLLSGYSIGGAVAQEMAKRLTTAGEIVSLLILIDAPARGRPPLIHWGNEAFKRAWRWQSSLVARLTGGPLKAIPPHAAMIAAHRRALNAHRAGAYLGPTVIIRATILPHPIKQWLDRSPQEWRLRKLVDPETPVIWTPGDHATIFAKPNVDVLAQQIQRQLDRVLAPSPQTVLG